MKEDQVFLTKEQAISLLSEEEYIHTFTNPAVNIMFGCDLNRDAIVDIINKTQSPEDIQIGGDHCRKTGHGLVVFDYDGDHWLFVQVDDDKLKEFDNQTTEP